MKKYILTKDFLEIAETYGIFQNLSGDANIEITNNTNEQGILLKPFQKVTINQQIYARKLGGGGTAQLMVLPFKNNSETVEEVDDENYYSGESYVDENLNRPRRNKNRHNNFSYPYDWQRPREQPPPMPPFPPQIPPPMPQMFPPDNSAPAVVEHDNFYMLRIPKDSLNGQNKFLVQINNSKGND